MLTYKIYPTAMRHLFTYDPVPMDAVNQVALQDAPRRPCPCLLVCGEVRACYALSQHRDT